MKTVRLIQSEIWRRSCRNPETDVGFEVLCLLNKRLVIVVFFFSLLVFGSTFSLNLFRLVKEVWNRLDRGGNYFSLSESIQIWLFMSIKWWKWDIFLLLLVIKNVSDLIKILVDRQAWSARRDLKEKPGVSDDSHISMKPKTPRTELLYFLIILVSFQRGFSLSLIL